MSQQPNRAGHSGARQVKGKKPGADKRRKEIRLMVVMIVIAVIMVIAAVLVSLYARWVRKPVLPPSPGQSGSVEESQNPGAASPDPAVSDDIPDEPDYDPVQPKVGGERKSEDFYTILVFGSDEASGLTDTIMVVSYDVTNQKATAMSIPRDTLVNAKFSGIDPKKVNASVTSRLSSALPSSSSPASACLTRFCTPSSPQSESAVWQSAEKSVSARKWSAVVYSDSADSDSPKCTAPSNFSLYR